MFEGFKARRASAEAARAEEERRRQEQAALAKWQHERDGVEELLAAARTDGSIPDGLVVHRDERCFGVLTNCSLVEERRGPGHFVAGSAGVSIPIGSLGGRPVRYRAGGIRGHYVQGTPSPTSVATGTLYLTDQRIVFLGTTQTRECRFDKLVGMSRDDELGRLTLSVSNRQHPIVVQYGAEVAAWVDFRVDLAMAHWRGDVDQMIAHLTEQLAAVDAARPSGPGAPSVPGPTPS